MKPDWFIEVATNVDDIELEWRQAQVGSVVYSFAAQERCRADRIAIELSEMLGDTAMVRVRHRLRGKRGIFFPRPRPARRVKEFK